MLRPESPQTQVWGTPMTKALAAGGPPGTEGWAGVWSNREGRCLSPTNSWGNRPGGARHSHRALHGGQSQASACSGSFIQHWHSSGQH